MPSQRDEDVVTPKLEEMARQHKDGSGSKPAKRRRKHKGPAEAVIDASKDHETVVPVVRGPRGLF